MAKRETRRNVERSRTRKRREGVMIVKHREKNREKERITWVLQRWRKYNKVRQ